MVDKGVLRQLTAVIAGSMSIMNVGIILGWTSPIMEELLGPNSPIPMTVDESSWFASVYNWGLILGSIPCGMIADRWGRRPVLLMIGPVALATWMALIFIGTFRGLIAVRLMQGLLAGGAYTVVPLYVGEIAGPKIRGALGTTFQIMMYVGILFVYVAGMYLDYGQLTYAAMAGPVLFCAFFPFVPESPHFYVMKNRLREAKRTMLWLRGDDSSGGHAVTDDEMNAVVECICEEMRDASFTDLFTDLVSLKALIVVQGLSVFRVMAGVPALIAYASITFAEVHVDETANRLSLVFACWLLFSSLPAAALSDRAGRRPLMIASSASCFALNAIICAYFYADRHTGYDVTTYGWLCVTATSGLCVAFNLGFGTLYSTINCELFPSNSRSLANALNTITLTFTSFVVLKAYPVIAMDGGMYRNYLISSMFCLFSTVFCWLWLPETKGQTFAAIQQQLRGTNRVT
ncbi:facilitated trehalose transporter Tret1-like [Sipha flava]|uniref:Facilitated trehalose transporter Tret1-like n=1 Tax=Sipha flava TaxID=143950 RepID=A0A8B8FKE8_9HEMI|nr:facilitated trehalose transporter Tret1-like [Sipha flava]